MSPTAIGDLKGTLSLSLWYEHTADIMRDATQYRDLGKLHRAKLRVDSDTFSLLPDDKQDELMELYAAAMVANGWGATA